MRVLPIARSSSRIPGVEPEPQKGRRRREAGGSEVDGRGEDDYGIAKAELGPVSTKSGHGRIVAPISREGK